MILSPIDQSDFNNEKISEYMNKAERFFLRCAYSEKEKDHIGYVSYWNNIIVCE